MTNSESIREHVTRCDARESPASARYSEAGANAREKSQEEKIIRANSR